MAALDPFGTLYRYVETVTSTAGNMSTDYSVGQVVSGVTLTIAARILIKDQADPIQNGIYAAQESGEPLRTDDMSVDSYAAGFYVYVLGGTAAGQAWECIGPNATVGTDPLVWQRIDALGTLDPARGGTGTAALGGTNALLYTPSANAPIASIAAVNSAVLVSSPAGVPSMSTVLPPNLSATNMRHATPQISDGGTRTYTIAPTTTLDASQQLLLPKTTSTQTFVLDSLAQTLANKTLVNATFADASGTKLATFDTSSISPGTVTLAIPAVGGTIATQAYVAGISGGISQRPACRAKTTGIHLVTASGSGVGKTLTSVLPGLLNILGGFDGVALATGDRVLVDSALFGSPSASCGIYTVTNPGGVLTSWVLTRATDADTSAELPTGTTTFVTSGATAAGTSWTLTTASPTIDVTPTVWTQSGTGTSYNFTGGLTPSGNSVSIGTSPTIGTTASSAFVNSSAVTSQVLLSSGTIGTAASYGPLPLGNANATSGTLPIASGGTSQTSFTANALHYGAFAQTNTLAAAVLTTDPAGVPSLSRTLPADLTFAGGPAIASGAFTLQVAAGTLTANATATFPAGAYADTVVLANTTQVLTNKSLSEPKILGALCDATGTQSLGLLPAPSAAYTLLAGTTLGTTTGDLTVVAPLAASTIRLRGTVSALSLTADPDTTPYQLQMPPTDGAAGYVLATDGAGVLNWVWREPAIVTYLSLLTNTAEATSTTYQTVQATTLPDITCTAATIAFTIGDVGARMISVRLVGTATTYAEYTGINAPGQYAANFLTLPTGQDLLRLQICKSADGDANPQLLGVTAKFYSNGM